MQLASFAGITYVLECGVRGRFNKTRGKETVV